MVLSTPSKHNAPGLAPSAVQGRVSLRCSSSPSALVTLAAAAAALGPKVEPASGAVSSKACVCSSRGKGKQDKKTVSSMNE